MKINTYLLIISVSLICAGCPDEDQITDSTVTIINKTNESIIYYSINKPKADTLLTSIPYPITVENSDSVETNSSAKFGGPFKKLLNDSSSDILMIYLFSRDTIEQVAWERIVDENLILRRYDLTLEDLEAMDWTVEYP
ncbi:MAG: hypothetical protein R3345_07490 [Fulvivirga sp.]|nr:hypothetical protein [Fulvivirga sp.]